MKYILATYEEALGKAVNQLFCSRNNPDDLKNPIATTFGIRQMLGTSKYLGLPSMIRGGARNLKSGKPNLRNII